MADNLIVNKGKKARLNDIPVTPGAITAIVDTKELYIDYSNDNAETRVKISDVEFIDAKSNDLDSDRLNVNPVSNPIDGKFYYFTKTKDVLVYSSTDKKWTKISTASKAILKYTGQFSDTVTIADLKDVMTADDSKLSNSDNISIGSLIIDNSYDLGYIAAKTGDSYVVDAISTSKYDTAITNHIYVNSESTIDTFRECGTIKYPYKSFETLYNNQYLLLTNDTQKIIHLMSDTTVRAMNLNSCEFVSDSSLEHNINLTYCKNITLSNCTIKDIFTVDSDSLQVNNCKIKSVNGSEALLTIDNLEINNTQSELDEPIKIYGKENNNANINCHNSNIGYIQLANDKLSDVSFTNSRVSLSQASGVNHKYNLQLSNAEVYNLMNLSTSGNIYFYSGVLKNESKPIIKANNIYLGTFDFGLAVPSFNGNIIEQSGLTSKQVFDTKERSYNNDKVNLESHLDAIDKKFKDIDTELHGSAESNIKLGEAFISANTFDSSEELLNTSYRTGDVVKYAGNSSTELINEFELTVSEDENAIEQINVTNITEDGLTISIPHTSVKFNMLNSKYFAKLFNTVSVRYKTAKDEENGTDGSVYDLVIYAIGKDYIKARIENSKLNDIFTDKNYITSCMYNQTVEVGQNDRLIKLSNGWDKLSASSSESGNYHIVKKFEDLYGIETDESRKLGTLAYVQDDELMYIWKTNGSNQKQWEEWSGGGGSGGGSTRARISQYGSSSIYREDNSPIDIQIQVSNCTTGVLTAEYQFVGDSLTKRSVSVNVDKIGIYDIKLTNIANQNGMLNVSVSFRSTDEAISNPQEGVNISFYIGNLLSIDNMYISELLNVEADAKYNINTTGGRTEVPAYNVNGNKLQNIDELTINYNALTYRNVNFNAYFTLYKNKTKITEFVSETAKLSASYKIHLPLTNSNGDEIEYTPGLYRLDAYCKDDMYTSQLISYSFILESESVLDVVLLNDNNISVAAGENINLQYLIIGKRSNRDTVKITPHVMRNNIDNAENYEEIVNLDKLPKTISFSHGGQLGNNYTGYLTAEPMFTGVDTVNSDDIVILCIANEYMNIVNESNSNLIFNLDSTTKSNSSVDKAKWMSSQIINDDVYAILHNFSYSDNGWINVNVNDNNIGKFGEWADSDSIVLKSDGYSSYCLINISPVYKYNDSSFDCNNGYTFEIKFKYNELYSDGVIAECVDEKGRGFIIKGNEVIFSPYNSIESATKDNSVSTKLTTDTWHTIALVLAVKTTDSYYKSKMYKNDMPGNSVAILYVDGTITGIVSGNLDNWYSDDNTNDRFISLFGKYDFTNKLITNYAKGEIMHVRLYNSVLTDSQVLNNYISNVHSLDNQKLLKTFNDFNENYGKTAEGKDTVKEYEKFGQLSTDKKSIPVLTISNANLAALDSIMGPDAKKCLFPNCGLELSYRGITLMKKYGCVVKVQGTSSTNYAIKNYKITWYDFDEEMPNEKIYNAEEANVSGLPKVDSYGTLIADDEKYKRTKEVEINGETKKNKKLKVSINGWLPENTFTLKADYMDSSHTHNTGTAHFANTYMDDVPPQKENSPYNQPSEPQNVSLTIDAIKESNVTQSQYDAGTKSNKVDKIQQAIEGFPVLIEYRYADSDGNVHQESKGIYQFNVDKNASTIFGYDKYDNNCKSYEISNNSTTAGAAGFDVDVLNPNASTGNINDNDLYMIKQDFEIRHHMYEELSEDDIDSQIEYLQETYGEYRLDISKHIADDEKSAYIQVFISEADENLASSISRRIVNDYTVTDIHSPRYGYIAQTQSRPGETVYLTYNKFALNLADETLRIGLDSPLYSNSASDTNCHMNDELLNLLIWMHDCKLDFESAKPTNKFYNEFSKHFDFDNMSKYILLVRTLGMADNLAKNMMITTWNAGDEKVVYLYDSNDKIIGIDYDKSTFCKWYLQFYDLDTSLGLDNVGNNAYDTSLDIYGHSRTDELILESEIDAELATDITTQSYTASSSLLWKLILTYFGKVDYSGSTSGGNYQIQDMYKQLRTTNVLTPEKLKNNFFDNITDRIGQYYFNLDAINKYFGYNFASSSDNGKYFYMCQGKSREHIAEWIDKRFIYMDSLYGVDNGNIPLRPVITGNATGNIFIQTKAPMYMPIQFADVNILESAQLGTAKYINRIPATFENDANIIIYQAENLLALRNLTLLNCNALNLVNATSLIELNCAELPNLTSLTIGSKLLQTLNLANSKLTSIDASELENLIELDISNSNIEKLTLSSNTSSATNITKLNIKNSQLTELDFSSLTSLESFGKINMQRTYSSLMNLLRTYKLIDSENETEYILRLINQFKSSLTSEHLKNLNEWVTSNNIATDDYTSILKRIMDNYNSDLGNQYLPGLAIYEITTADTKVKSFENIKFNSNKLRAIILTSDVAGIKIGNKENNISIISNELRYFKLNNCNIQTGNININNPKLEEVVINSTYNYIGSLDLSIADNLNSINTSGMSNLTKIIISPNLRHNDSLKTINLNSNIALKWFIDSNESYDENADTLNFTGLNLNTLNLGECLSFRKIRGLHMTLNSSQSFACNVSLYTGGKVHTLNVYYRTRNIISGFENCELILANNISLAKMFEGRLNMTFDSTNLIFTNLNKATSISYMFNLCEQVDYNWVKYIMSNISTTCTNANRTFHGCYSINFPNSTVPKSLFGTNCKGLTDISEMFANINRNYFTNANRQLKLTLANGIFDNLTNITNLKGIFNDAWFSLDSSSNASRNIRYNYYKDYNATNDYNATKTSRVYTYDSYVSKCNINIFDKLTKINSDGLGLATQSIFKGSNSDTLIIEGAGEGDNERSFNTIFRNLSSVTNFTNLFSATKAIKYSSGTNVTIDNRIFAKGVTPTACAATITRCFASMNSNLTINFKNLLKYVSNPNGINCSALFSNYTKSFNFNDLWMDADNLLPILNASDFSTAVTPNQKITSAEAMFENCKNMTGYLFPAVKRENSNGITTPILPIKRTTDNTDKEYRTFFTKQDKLTSTAGMFYNCINFGGLVDYDDSTQISTVANDLPLYLFKDLTSLTNASHMFEGCTTLSIQFEELYTTNLSTTTKSYLFDKCTNLSDVSYMFAKCTNLVTELPTYGCPGSNQDDVLYYYYDITKIVYAWLDTLTPIELDYIASPNYFLAYQIIDGEQYNPIADNRNPDGTLAFKPDEKQYRIYNIERICNWSQFKYKLTYMDKIERDNQDPEYKLYQYYKTCNVDESYIVNDETIKPIYEGDKTDTSKNHNDYIMIPGFFYTGNSSQITTVEGCFRGCSNLQGQIPPNLFRGMSKVTTINSIFYDCKSIGLNQYFTDDMARHPANDRALDVPNIPYMYPFGLFDDMNNLANIDAAFTNVLYLSRPYRALAYGYSTELPDVTVTSINKQYGEVYALPKYFLYFNPNLKTCISTFSGSDVNANSLSNLFGDLNPNMFITNSNITNISNMFKCTMIRGSKSIDNSDGTIKYYIGKDLLKPLSKLADCSGLFNYAQNLNYLVHAPTRDLIFSSAIHKPNIKTAKFVTSDNTAAGAQRRAYLNTFNDTVKGKIVLNVNASLFDSDYTCEEYFRQANKSDTLM